MGKTQFETFLEEEVSKVKGIYYPVKAGFLRRVFIRRIACSKLHPNPDDEFCFPDIGPNYEIMSRYEKDYRRVGSNPADMSFIDSSIREPIEIEKIHPDGYMILNGHHRWGAAIRTGIDRISVKIVDLTQEKDIRKMLKSSGFDRRVTLDLDEVVFGQENNACIEKPLPFPLKRIYRERLRLGIPSLFHLMNSYGYDIWIYTARYYSLEYLQQYFKHYRVHVTGIVTGAARKGPAGSDTRKELEKLLDSKYKSTVHIDSSAVLRTVRGSGSFEEFALSGSDESWPREVTEIFEKMRKNEQTGINPENAGVV